MKPYVHASHSELDFKSSASFGVNNVGFSAWSWIPCDGCPVIQLGVSLDVHLGIRNCPPCELYTVPISQDGNVHLVYMLSCYFSRKYWKHGNTKCQS